MAEIFLNDGGSARSLGLTADPQIPGKVTALENRVTALEGASAYELPPASASSLGGVKVDGTTITAAEDGTISAVNGGTGPALSDAVDSDSGTTAASSRAVKTAYDTATAARSTADAAAAAAGTAQETATTAQSAAATAQSAATTAQGTADGAKATADAAWNAANTAQGTANAAIPRTGARGALAGCQSATALWGDQSITSTSPDAITLNTNGWLNVYFTAAAADVSAVKTLTFTASGASGLAVHGAEWANRGTAPVWGNAWTVLVLAAHFTGGRVVLHVLDNTQA